MPVQGRRHLHFHAAKPFRGFAHQLWKVPPHMRAQRQEIWNYNDARDSARHQTPGCVSQVRLSQFQKRRLHEMTARRGHSIRDIPYGLIGGFYARTVSEDNETGHTWISDGAL